jgi:crossover junction endodeoxyribonuclease RuvC
MGIDPGLSATGIGVIDYIDSRYQYVHGGILRTRPSEPLQKRLRKIFEGVSGLIKQYKPDVCVIEEIFYSTNVKTAITMGHTRGVILLAGALEGVEIAAYSPREIKLAVVGVGSASKEQVQFMVQRILNLSSKPNPMDISDALSMAICHAQRMR